MTNKIILAYLVYLPIALGLTLYVARTLFRNARVFMLDIFRGKADIADSTNRLFEVGFYLVNMGFALKILEINSIVETNQQLVEQLANKIGGFAIYLGIMLFLNLYLFFRGRRKSRENRPLPPAGNVIAEPTY
jgi:predicted PurR-regulated permease PerM